LPITGGDQEKKRTENRKKKKPKGTEKTKQVPPSEKPMLMRRGADKREKNKRKMGWEI
jgi:hypothetical protein